MRTPHAKLQAAARAFAETLEDRGMEGVAVQLRARDARHFLKLLGVPRPAASKDGWATIRWGGLDWTWPEK